MTRFRALLVLGLGAAIWGVACGGPGEPVPPAAPSPAPSPSASSDSSGLSTAAPLPDLGAVEAPVAAAIRAAREKVTSDPLRASAWGGLALVFHAHDFLTEAVASYRQAESLDPADWRWPYLAGRALMGADLVSARAALQRAVVLRPESAAVFITYGDLLLDLGEVGLADEQYLRALELATDSPWVLLGRARVALALDDPETARRLLRAAVAAKPDFREAHSSLAQVSRRLGDSDAAQIHMWAAANFSASSAPPDEAYDLVVSRGASFRWASRRGMAHTEGGRFADAEREFRAALATVPDDPATLANLGGSLAAQGNIAEALEVYRKALAIDPQQVGAQINLAQALLQSGDLDGAAEMLEQALAVDPLAPEAHLNLALVRARQQRWDQSLEHGRTALRANPGDVRALDLVGNILARQGDLDSALDLWLRVIRIDPRQLETLERVAGVLASRGKHREAVAWLRKGLQSAPNSSRLLLFLAWELAVAPDGEVRDGAEAWAKASRVRRGYPQMPRAADVAAAALAERGEFSAAVREAAVALELAESQGQEGLAAEIRARLGLYEQARPYRLSR